MSLRSAVSPDVPVQFEQLAAVLGASDQAAPGLAALRQALKATDRRPTRRIPTLAFIWRDPWMAVGAETYAGRSVGAVRCGESGTLACRGDTRALRWKHSCACNRR
jgi:ABC-type Fe3+-hydroxamate transport system substrate-binding protein